MARQHLRLALRRPIDSGLLVCARWTAGCVQLPCHPCVIKPRQLNLGRVTPGAAFAGASPPLELAKRSIALQILIEPFSRRGIDLGRQRTCRPPCANSAIPERRFCGAVQVPGTQRQGLRIVPLPHGASQRAGLRCGLYYLPHLVSCAKRDRLGPSEIQRPSCASCSRGCKPLPNAHALQLRFELIHRRRVFLAFAEAALRLSCLEVDLDAARCLPACHPDRQVVGFKHDRIDMPVFSAYLGL